jgi:hypothetical protein
MRQIVAYNVAVVTRKTNARATSNRRLIAASEVRS